jgi:hypothetical protein
MCKDKSYLGCSSAPPAISRKAIRKLSALNCDIDASQVSNEALSKKKTQTMPIGSVPPKKKNKKADDKLSNDDDV